MANEQNNNSQGQLKIQTGKAMVARGRSIDVPVGGKGIVVGTTEGNQPVTRVPTKTYYSGQTVELPLEEIKTLRASGYLVDPDNVAPPVGEGPQFGNSEGAQTRAA